MSRVGAFVRLGWTCLFFLGQARPGLAAGGKILANPATPSVPGVKVVVVQAPLPLSSMIQVLPMSSVSTAFPSAASSALPAAPQSFVTESREAAVPPAKPAAALAEALGAADGKQAEASGAAFDHAAKRESADTEAVLAPAAGASWGEFLKASADKEEALGAKLKAAEKGRKESSEAQSVLSGVQEFAKSPYKMHDMDSPLPLVAFIAAFYGGFFAWFANVMPHIWPESFILKALAVLALVGFPALAGVGAAAGVHWIEGKTGGHEYLWADFEGMSSLLNAVGKDPARYQGFLSAAWRAHFSEPTKGKLLAKFTINVLYRWKTAPYGQLPLAETLNALFSLRELMSSDQKLEVEREVSKLARAKDSREAAVRYGRLVDERARAALEDEIKRTLEALGPIEEFPDAPAPIPTQDKIPTR